MTRAVIDLSQTPIIKGLVERSADDRGRLAGVESVQAQTINEVITRLDQILILLNGGVIPPAPTPVSISNTPGTSALLASQVAGFTAPANALDTRLTALGA